MSFKDKDCVSDTIEEMDLVKTKLVGKKHYDTLDIRNWEVEMAIPTNDIIWTELNKGVSRSLLTRMILNLLLLTLSAIVIFGIIFIDQELENELPSFVLVAVKYVSPLALSLFTFYTIPWLIFKVVQFERHERKSEKEESFMSKNSMLMTLNCLVVPFIICAIFSSMAPSIVVEDKYPSTPKQPKNVLNVTDDPLSEIFPKPMTIPLNSTNATSEEAKQPATTSQTHENETQTAFTVLYYEVIN